MLRTAFARYEALQTRDRPEDPRRARAAGQPRDRPARADAAAAGDPRGARRPVHHRRGSRPADVRRARRPAAAPRGGARRGAGPAPAGAARARGDHGLADGALAPRPDPRARRRTSTTRIRRSCATSSNAELAALIARFETDPDDAGARDWSDLDQRMHYIVHLFRVLPRAEDLVRRAVHARADRALPRGRGAGRGALRWRATWRAAGRLDDCGKSGASRSLAGWRSPPCCAWRLISASPSM